MLDLSLTKADDIFRKYREAQVAKILRKIFYHNEENCKHFFSFFQLDLSDAVTNYQKIIEKIPTVYIEN